MEKNKKIFARHGIINGIKTNTQVDKKYKEHAQEVIKLYNNNYAVEKIYKLFGINRHEVLLILVENSVPIRRKKLKNALVE